MVMMEDISPDRWISHPDECLSIVKQNVDSIPFLGCVPLHLLQDGQLVRFRGMVQDMPNPVYYFSKYEVVHKVTGSREVRSGKYKDSLSCGVDETVELDTPNCENDERKPYLCVSIPGLNKWAQTKSVTLQTDSSDQPTSSGTGGSKRTADEMETEDEEDASSVKKKQFEPPRETGVTAPTTEAHFPLPGPDNHACLVTIYDLPEGSIKLNEMIEVIGFVWLSPSYEDEETLPSSLLPRVHAVYYEKIVSSNPLWHGGLSIEPILNEAEKLRSDLHLGLTQLFLGDTLAADYFICYLISSVYTRQDVMALGKFCLNISNIPLRESYSEEVYNIVSHLVPKSHYIPMSLQNMNRASFIPEKDYTTNRLKSSILQLSDQTHLLIDETKLETGKLESQGIFNLQALNLLISLQKLDYDFKYYKMEFNTNYPVLILSEGKSMLPSDCHVVLKPEESCLNSLSENYKAVENYFQEPLLSKIRLYLSVTSKEAFTFSDQLQETIQNDFVSMRKEPNSKVNADDLHSLLILARLVSLSYGQNSLCLPHWEKIKRMEAERKSRIVVR